MCRLKIDTAYRYLEIRYKNKGLRILGALMFIIYHWTYVYRTFTIYVVLAQLTGINVNILIIVMGVICYNLLICRGLKSVLWTDFIQGIVLIVGVLH